MTKGFGPGSHQEGDDDQGEASAPPVSTAEFIRKQITSTQCRLSGDTAIGVGLMCLALALIEFVEASRRE
jgi:hypothetical protein